MGFAVPVPSSVQLLFHRRTSIIPALVPDELAHLFVRFMLSICFSLHNSEPKPIIPHASVIALPPPRSLSSLLTPTTPAAIAYVLLRPSTRYFILNTSPRAHSTSTLIRAQMASREEIGAGANPVNEPLDLVRLSLNEVVYGSPGLTVPAPQHRSMSFQLPSSRRHAFQAWVDSKGGIGPWGPCWRSCHLYWPLKRQRLRGQLLRRERRTGRRSLSHTAEPDVREDFGVESFTAFFLDATTSYATL
jgi:hypothetical protein